jgi:hypothetical protein
LVLHAPDPSPRRGYPINVALRHLYRSADAPGFLFFLDDDDVVYPMFSRKMHEALVVSGADVVYAASNKRIPWEPARPAFTPLPPPCLLLGNFIPINSYAVRFSALKSAHLLFSEDLEYVEDWDFLVRALGRGLDFFPLEDTLSEFRVIGDGNSPTKTRPGLWATCEKRVRREVDRVLGSLGRKHLLQQFLAFPGELLPRLSQADQEFVMAALSLIDEKCPALAEGLLVASRG